VKGRGEDGGGEGKQSQAEPCLTPKKRNKGGGRQGAKRNRKAEEKSLRTAFERGTKTGRMRNRSLTSRTRQRGHSRRGTADHSKAFFSPVMAQN